MDIQSFSQYTESILAPPFEWCAVPGGTVKLDDAEPEEGTAGGIFQVPGFWMAKYPVTNAQYRIFADDPAGYADPRWWIFSPQGVQWQKDRRRAHETEYPGENYPRTRVSWFDSMAFCAWLSYQMVQQAGELANWPLDLANPFSWPVRLPTELEWQRAAVGDTGWSYPWGNDFDDSLSNTRCNCSKLSGQATPVDQYPQGASPFGVMDLVGNLWEWCLDPWGMEQIVFDGYHYRATRGGAWNVSNPEYLKATGRTAQPPRGRLNDCGFRCAAVLNQ